MVGASWNKGYRALWPQKYGMGIVLGGVTSKVLHCSTRGDNQICWAEMLLNGTPAKLTVCHGFAGWKWATSCVLKPISVQFPILTGGLSGHQVGRASIVPSLLTRCLFSIGCTSPSFSSFSWDQGKLSEKGFVGWVWKWVKFWCLGEC